MELATESIRKKLNEIILEYGIDLENQNSRYVGAWVINQVNDTTYTLQTNGCTYEVTISNNIVDSVELVEGYIEK